MFMFIL